MTQNKREESEFSETLYIDYDIEDEVFIQKVLSNQGFFDNIKSRYIFGSLQHERFDNDKNSVFYITDKSDIDTIGLKNYLRCSPDFDRDMRFRI